MNKKGLDVVYPAVWLAGTYWTSAFPLPTLLDLPRILISLPFPPTMKKTCLFALFLAVGCLAFPQRSPAPVTVRPGEGATYTAPGSEEVPNQKDAQTQFDTALEKEKKGDIGSALAGYRKTVRRFSKSSVAPAAQYKIGEILEKKKDYNSAATAYETLIKNYPHSTDFNNALEGEFRIGNLFLDGIAKQAVLGVPTLPSRDRAVAIYTVIVRNAPFSRLAPLAQLNIGQAQAHENDYKGAITAYQVVVDKYPTDPAASEALYQIAYCYLQISRSGSYDRIASQHARESFEDYISAYPNSEKTPQARENLANLTSQQTGGSLEIADYYYGQKLFKAAVVYYNDVIRQQPNSPDSAKAQAKLSAIRAKYGDKYFTDSAATAGGAGGAKPVGVTPKLGDGRLQAQTDTAKRPDYVGPPVSAPTPPPVAVNPGAGVLAPPDAGAQPGPHPEPTPPPVPEGEQPTLPAQ